MKKILLFTLICLLAASCAPAATATSSPSTPTAAGPTSTVSPRDKLATAAAIDAATKAAKPPATATPPGTPLPTAAPISHPGTQDGQMFWWNDAVFYEVFIRSFKDSDGNGRGDINGLIEKLDYLNDGDPATTNDLGVTGLWLMPIMESPSYHGYDVVDYYTVDQEYGTNEDFQRLMDEAHKRGIRIVVDLVINHTSTESPWFKASDDGDPEYRDWYIWAEKDPGYAGSWGQDVWYSGKSGYYYAMFWSGMPDLNLSNPAVTEEVDKIIKYWLVDMAVDGFRLDAVKHYIEQDKVQENTPATHAWLKNFYQYYKSVNPDAFTVGETWTSTANAVKYVGDEVDVSFEFDLAGSIMHAAGGPSAASLGSQMQNTLKYYPEGQYAVFLTNHDQNRAMSVLNNVDKAKLAAVMLLTSPGVPFLYYGEEIGMTGTKPDEDIRRPMQWTGDSPSVGFSTMEPWRPASEDYPQVNVALQTDDPNSLLSLYRDLIHLRNDHPALRTGDTLVVKTNNPSVYALLRYNTEEAFLTLVNVNANPITDYSLELTDGPLADALKAVTVIGLPDPSAPQISAGGWSGYLPFIELPGRSYAIIQLTP
jgi:glycosidase